MLASKIKRHLPIPHEEGEWMELRAIGAKKLDEAADIRSRERIAALRAMGEEVLAAIGRMNSAEPTGGKDEPEPESDPLDGYDVDTLLRAGITAWSYGAKLTPANIDDLDATTRKWAATEILALCRETEPERKNA
jgi:hypothetical protein